MSLKRTLGACLLAALAGATLAAASARTAKAQSALGCPYTECQSGFCVPSTTPLRCSTANGTCQQQPCFF